MKQTITTIGEALIDFIPEQRDCPLKEVTTFYRVCGGAPTNVAAAIGKLGGKARMITQVGNDAFGDYIVDQLEKCGIDTESICRTEAANTALAFVSLKTDGNRDFSFYRKPSADMLMEPEQLQPAWLEDTAVLHFGSVSLVESPMKQTHVRAIQLAKEQGAVISFDPNIRLPLFPSAEACQAAVREFLPYVDLLKVSDEELEFVTGETDIQKAAPLLFEQGCKMILYSKGKQGAMLLTPQVVCTEPNPKVKVKDTTGAGDAICGAFLYCLGKNGITPENLNQQPAGKLQKWLRYAVYYANYSVTGSGAITSYPDDETFQRWLRTFDSFIAVRKNEL